MYELAWYALNACIIMYLINGHLLYAVYRHLPFAVCFLIKRVVFRLNINVVLDFSFISL